LEKKRGERVLLVVSCLETEAARAQVDQGNGGEEAGVWLLYMRRWSGGARGRGVAPWREWHRAAEVTLARHSRGAGGWPVGPTAA
jgi:hypothetical protein